MIPSADADPIRPADVRDLVWRARHVLPNTDHNQSLIARAERGDGDAMERLSGRLEGRR